MCRSVCGHCKNGETCDKYNGTCLNGCEPNFKTPLCQGIYESMYEILCAFSVSFLIIYNV